MLLGNAAQLDRAPYVTDAFKDIIRQAVKLAETEPDGKYHLDGDDVFVMLVTTETYPTSKQRSEIHKDHLDIQILFSGCETFGISNYAPEALLDQAMENDVHFIPEIEKESFVTLYPNDFIVFYPGEAHRPQCSLDEEVHPIRKAVVKIHKRWL
jgi:biofilm protein TabA